ncbi:MULTISPECIES: septal ring lytic transglycosylase RlpA family protein [unclassified Variovorax]|uniref:septal ring lytic transglycosylase RlpA family protein n=1 Tax=unclassified Variovorax TaxID=663243 RepID=UPI001BD6C560|nr:MULTISPECIES: septal ring lytic transglycosylase RlpA family protein [unclassified Variovorax]
MPGATREALTPFTCAAPVLVAAALAAALAGCASGPRSGSDGAEASVPANLDRVPDAEPRVESIRASGSTSKPYVALGQTYVPMVDDRPFRESGLASWYGRKFHSGSTASGEPYDMYAMTAAHKTLPLPSYARVRNPANGREVIVRVNDRGPFVDGRVIDLSYTAALKLDLLRGVAPVEIERITNQDIRTGAWRRPGDAAVAQDTSARLPPSDAVAVPVGLTTEVSAPPPRGAMGTDLAPMSPIPLPRATANPPPGTATGAAEKPAPATGFWVQLGAFSQREGAAAFQEKVSKQMPALKMMVFSENGMHRLQAGPYATRESAQTAGEQVRNGLNLAPVIVERR